MSEQIRFVEELPPPRPSGRAVAEYGWTAAVRAEVRKRPGIWAEVLRGPASERGRLSQRGVTLRRGTRNADMESATRKDGDEVVVYARSTRVPAPAAPDE